jgi:hypothetical protein
MMMTSNLRLIGSEGEVLTAHEAAPHLNRFVRSLPWQAEIWRMLELERQSGALVAAERNSRTGATPSSIGISMPLGGTPN